MSIPATLTTDPGVLELLAGHYHAPPDAIQITRSGAVRVDGRGLVCIGEAELVPLLEHLAEEDA